MYRPIIAVMLWIILIGGLAVYMQTRQKVEAPTEIKQHLALDTYSMEITTTAILEPDPFALRITGEQPASFMVSINGKKIVHLTDRVEKDHPLKINPLKGIAVGLNEIYLEAYPPLEMLNSFALRIQLFRDSQLLLDRSFWSEGGPRIAASFLVEIEKPGDQQKDHAH